jgi:ClpP class serine protease
MNLSDLWWVALLFIGLQPVIRQRILEAKRLGVLKRLEQSRRSRVIALVHRQETMSLLGFPIVRYIDVNDSEEVLRAVALTDPDYPIDLVVHTPGGLVLAAGQIAHALKRHRGKVTVFVPHYAMSGAPCWRWPPTRSSWTPTPSSARWTRSSPSCPPRRSCRFSTGKR